VDPELLELLVQHYLNPGRLVDPWNLEHLELLLLLLELLWLPELQRNLVLLDSPERHFVLQWPPELLLLPGHRCFPGVPLELLELL